MGWREVYREDGDINELNEQVYSKLENNIDHLYDRLEELKQDGKSRFKASNIENLSAKEAGIALTALAAFGLLSYRELSDGNLYMGDFDLGELEGLKEDIREHGSLEEMKEWLEE